MDKINPKKDHKKPKINQSPKTRGSEVQEKVFFFPFISLKNRLILWIAWLIHSAHDSLLKVEVPYAFSETFQSNENFVTSWTKVLLKKTHSMSTFLTSFITRPSPSYVLWMGQWMTQGAAVFGQITLHCKK